METSRGGAAVADANRPEDGVARRYVRSCLAVPAGGKKKKATAAAGGSAKKQKA